MPTDSKTCLFTDHTIEEHAQSLADYLPDGYGWQAKNIQGTNFRNLLLGLAAEFERFESVLSEYSCQYDLETTTLFIEQWEKAVGIPNDCFDASGDIEERRRHIKATLAAINAITIEDYINIAQILGFNVSISPLEGEGGFPLTFPFTFFNSSKEVKFTLVVEFLDIIDFGVFPYTFPFTFNDGAQIQNELTCFLRKIVPANVALDFRYQQPVVDADFLVTDDFEQFVTDGGDNFIID